MTLEEFIGESLGGVEIISTSDMDNTEGWDSLNHILLCDNIAKVFNIKLTFDEMIEIISVTQIRELLDRKGIDYATI